MKKLIVLAGAVTAMAAAPALAGDGSTMGRDAYMNFDPLYMHVDRSMALDTDRDGYVSEAEIRMANEGHFRAASDNRPDVVTGQTKPQKGHMKKTKPVKRY